MDKPAGPSSHDVVVAARRAVGTRRIGHLGTLDPFATGVLVLLVGRATRLAAFTAGWSKQYEGTIRLGSVTSTDDGTGEVLRTSDTWRAVAPEQVRTTLAALAGTREQRPPAYSAKQVRGERAYRRARRGESVTLAPVTVTVHELEVVDVALPDIRFRATVSGGTYVRALARDAGEALGCGAHLAALRRTAVGPYRVEDAVPLEALAGGKAPLRPMAGLVEALPRRDLDPDEYTGVRHGRGVPAGTGDREQEAVALFADGRLVAVGRREGAVLKPRVVLEG